MSRVRGVVACHAGLANALVEAVDRISGMGSSFIAISNDECDRDALRGRLAEAIGSDPVVVFVDMPTGSCMMAALQELQNGRQAAVVTGVNLPMLIDFVFHPDDSLAEAASRAVAAGAQAIKVP